MPTSSWPPKPVLALRILGVILVVIVGIVTMVCIYFIFFSNGESYDVTSPLPPSDSILGVFKKGAVVSRGLPCAGIGRDMLKKGGSAVDGAIATLLCEGVCAMHAMGVGGGSLWTIYDKPTGKTYTMVARETAPAAATTDMYIDNPEQTQFGAIAAGIPGELKGYQEAHKKFGKLPWKELFKPTIKLCEEGVPISKMLADLFVSKEEKIRSSPTFVETILMSTENKLPKEGDFIKLPLLAKTLKLIAESPKMADELYNGKLTKMFVKDIQDGGGIITEKDMHNYKVRWEEPISANLSDGMTVYSAALPGSGILVAFILRVLDGLLEFAYSDLQRSLMIIETFKHAYGRRTHLGDPHFVDPLMLNETVSKLTDEESIREIRSQINTTWTSNDASFYGAQYMEDSHGTNNVVVVSPDGSAVAATSTINTIFGCKFVSTSTGILMNNEMDDFSTPGVINFFNIRPSKANFIKPGKRPMSSMSPTVILDSDGDVRLVVGGAGGSRITTQTSLVIMRHLWLGKNIKEAIDVARFHHQLLPMEVFYEYGILKDMVDGWKAIGHKTQRIKKTGGGFDCLAVITGIARVG